MGVKCYKKGYPRPQLVRGGFTPLNGRWAFAFDQNDGLESAGYERGFASDTEINVPFSYETAASGIGKTEHCACVWYCREIQAEPREGERVILWFEGADYLSRVWVNGAFAGQNEGAYHRFGFDITKHLRKGANTLAVKCEDKMDGRRIRGKQRWYNEERFECFYTQTTGIYKDVWLETVPDTRVESLRITPLYSERKVRFDAGIANACGAELEIAVSFKGEPVASVRVAAKGEVSVDLDIGMAGKTRAVYDWTPDNPDLYDAELRVYRDGTAVDTAGSYFGFRDIRAAGGAVLLNRFPFCQKLVLDQGYWPESGLTPPSEEALMRDIELAKSMGFNGARKHQKTEDERYLYWADVLGFAVWCEMPSCHAFSDGLIGAFTDQWQRVVRQNYNHPSVLAWVPFNESWGIENVATDAAQKDFSKSAYRLTKALDPMRPVISNDGWEHTESDILTLHNYGADPGCIAEQVLGATGEGARFSGQRRAFADGCGYGGQPVMISEYGGIAMNGHRGWGYGEHAADGETLLGRIRALTGGIKTLPRVYGYCYTQLTDVQQEINGLLYEDRTPKIPPDEIKRVTEIKEDGGELR
jgi:beta-galactosidase/beta-glucuronidase